MSKKQAYIPLTDKEVKVKYLTTLTGVPRFKHLIYYSIVFNRLSLSAENRISYIKEDNFFDIDDECLGLFVLLTEKLERYITAYREYLIERCNGLCLEDDTRFMNLYCTYRNEDDPVYRDNILDHWMYNELKNKEKAYGILDMPQKIKDGIDMFLNMNFVSSVS